ncbi:ABC transporter ATP-binding protein [Streptomyces sp. PR69]|uniref:ABC transporter ATP-binding protein n=1 Tax=Streptomyces sp. PR69 TaxID=2984950 RepID=UPI002264E78C|nr:ABC transporter ATP-binding protein [Streptomyces sp. PR69]
MKPIAAARAATAQKLTVTLARGPGGLGAGAGGGGTDGGRGASARLLPQARRFLARRKGVLARLAVWSLLESAQTFLGGYCLAQALDRGFLAGRTDVGLLWLTAAAVAVLAGGPVVRGVFAQLAELVEPLRDGLVRRAVAVALHEATEGGAARAATRGHSAVVSRLTHQTEIARDSFAGLVFTARSFVFTAAGALAGLVSLAPQLLVVVLPPLAAGLLLFLATLRPMAAAQRRFLDRDEAFAELAGSLRTGLRDIVACGTQPAMEQEAQHLIGQAAAAARSLARWAAVRTLALGVAGQLPVLVLLAATPWLLEQGVTAGALLGALAYLAQALLPALHALMTAVGAAGARLLVVLDRLAGQQPPMPAEAGARAADRGASPPPLPLCPGGVGDPHIPQPGARPQTPRTAFGRVLKRRTGWIFRPVRDSSRREGPRSPASSGGTPGRNPEQTEARGSGGGAPGNGVRGGAPAASGPAVECRAVTVSYGPRTRPVVNRLDLTVRAGEHLAVVGPSGAGKSTLTHVLSGLLTPDEGAVWLAGEPVDAMTAAELAQRRVLIPQQAYLFTGTVRENLLQLNPDASSSDGAAAVDALGLGPLTARIGGLDAMLDPAVLSEGERQLLCLARAYAAPAPLLILDEATCHLDPAAEARAERALAERPGTLLVVAHRLSSARRADRVLVLDPAGAVCGTHEELLRRSARYRELFAHWQGGP